MRRDQLVERLRGGEVADADPEVVDRAAGAQRAVVDGLDARAVRVEQEGAVVVVAVLRPRPGLAVRAAPGGDAGLPERVDLRAGRRHEADVQPPGRLALGEGEVVPLRELLVGVRLPDPDRREHRLVEALRGLPVGDADRHVVEHRRDYARRVAPAAERVAWAA
jgi:hypothetical protein